MYTGCKVSVKYGAFRYRGTIVDLDWNSVKVELEEGFYKGKAYWFNLDDVEPLPEEVYIKCECGAQKTYEKECAPHFHSHYCPAYKPENIKD